MKKALYTFLFIIMSISIFAADQVVTSNANSGGGSLRQAIIDAGDGDEITFNLSAGNETITILSELAIAESLTINGSNDVGSGVDVTVQVTTPGTSTYRVFNINASGKTITLSNLTIKGGNISGNGGGIYIAAGTVTIEKSSISNSKASNGGGIYNLGTLTIIDGTISLNNATQTEFNSETHGGGIFNASTLTINNSTISENTAASTGEDYNFTYGGGIYNEGTLTINNSTITGNTATSIGIQEEVDEAYGGGICNDGTSLINNTTICNNTSDGATLSEGGGISLYGTLTIQNSIIANNSGDFDYENYSGTLTDNGYNFVESTNAGAGSNGFNNGTNNAVVGVDPTGLSASLSYEGGFTKVLKVTAGNIATGNAGSTTETTDQRGYYRTSSAITRGAYQYDGVVAKIGSSTSWTSGINTFSTIQAAENDASSGTASGSEIILAGTAIYESGITIDKSVTIQGTGASSTFVQADVTPGTASDRVFNITSGTVTFEDMTIRNGDQTEATQYTIKNGGGIFIGEFVTSVSLNHCSISNNNVPDVDLDQTEGYGGGLYCGGGTLTIQNSTINGNSCKFNGGGIRSSGSSTVVINNSLIHSNQCGNWGGGISHGSSSITVRNSTIFGNATTGTVDAFENPVLEKGGGGVSIYGDATFNNVTISGNTANNNEHDGGGLYFYGNGTLTVQNCILGDNSASGGTGDDYYYLGGTLNDNGYNIVESQDGSSTGSGKTFTATTNITGSQANLFGTAQASQTLADNGGSSQTLAIETGSVAISAGTWDASITTDQRGETRLDPPTIGAFEYPVELATVTTTAASSIGFMDATSGGEVTDEGGGIVSEKGICWSKSSSPTTSDVKKRDYSGSNPYSKSMYDFVPNTTYYIRAYAINSAGTAYGSQISFTTASYGLASAPTNGNGSEASPYEISSLNELAWMMETESSWDSYFELTADIDASDASSWDGSKGFAPIGRETPTEDQFNGFLEGNGHIISNLYIDRPNTNDVGLFGYTDRNYSIDNSYVQNLGLTEVDFTGGYRTAGLIARSTSLVSNCYVTGSVTGDASNSIAAGLIGQSHKLVQNSYSRASVSAEYEAAGFISFNNSGIENCYSTGAVTDASENLDGFCNDGDGHGTGTIADSFWDTETSGQSSSSGGTGETTENMKTQSTFTDAGWDFAATPIWKMDAISNDGYPYLAWQEFVYYYMAKADGDWSSYSSVWFVNTAGGTTSGDYTLQAIEAPTASNSGGIIIDDNIDVTVTASTSIDQTTVDAGASIIVNSVQTLTIANGDGDDLTVAGTGDVDVNGTIDATGATITYSDAGTMEITGTATSLGTFTAGTGTVSYDGGSQTILNTSSDGITYNAVTLSGSGTKTFSGTTTATGGITVSATLNIIGDGAATTFVQAAQTSGTATNRVFTITAGTVSLEDMTIRNGYTAHSTNDVNDGAGILIDGASSVTVNHCVITNNKVKVAVGYGVGGGIACISSADVQISECEISNNHAKWNGGGIYMLGNLTMSNSTVNNNDCENWGGGILLDGTGTSVITNSTISNNATTNSAKGGGAIAIWSESATLKFLTVANNTATGIKGGGIYLEDDNSGNFYISNCLIANNTGNEIGNDFYRLIGAPENATLHDNGYNIVEYSNLAADNQYGLDNATDILYNTKYNDGTTSSTAWNRNGADLTNQNLNLSSTLADNGGSTETLAISSGSFAIYAGSWDASVSTDQRGEDRHQYYPTIGAYELTPYSGYWTAGASTSVWNTAENWEEGSVAESTDNVTIPPGLSNDPVIGNSPESPAECNDLNIISGATLTVSPGKALTINGNLTNSGTLTIGSTADGTGSLIVEGTASGNVTVQRYVDEIPDPLKGDAKWHYVSSPVSGQVLDGPWMSANSIAQAGNDQYQFYRFDEDKNYWIYFDYEGTAPEPFGDNTFVEARGYAATRIDAGTYSFTGTVRTSDVNYLTTYTADNGEGCNLVGNPFTSSLGITSNASTTEKFLTVNADLLDNSYEAIYIWDEAADYTFGSQDYKTISNAVVGGRVKLSNDYIQPGQAFMVKVASDASAYNLAFNENMQAHASDNYYKNTEETWPTVELVVESNNGLTNSTAIGFNENMTLGLDPSFDVGKMKGNPDIALYTKLIEDNGVDFAIQALPDNDIENFVIPVGVDVAESGVFEFSVYQEQLDNYNIVLEDRQENTFTNLRWDTYFATISESGTGRFYLHFKDATGIGETAPETKISFRYLDGKILITNPDMEKGSISLVNISGQILDRYEMNGNGKQEFSINQSTGIYIISIKTDTATISHKLFLK